LLGLGNELHPGLYKTFVDTPEKEIVMKPTVKELRQAWNDINKELTVYLIGCSRMNGLKGIIQFHRRICKGAAP
jgi:hypothetical protein